MTRSNAREIAVHLIYACECSELPAQEALEGRLAQEYYDGLSAENEVYTDRPNQKQKNYLYAVVEGVEQKREELRGYISEFSVGWNISRISRLARAVMELAIYEALYVDDVPMNVAIHEAIVLAQKYEEEETVSFVNGVLGAFSRKYGTAPEGTPEC